VKRGQTFCSDGCRGAYFYYGKHKEHDTDIEILVDDALNKLNINHECQYRIGRYIADFYLPEYNLVIEADGEFWHNLPKMIEKDKRKDAYLAAHHYNLLRLPGNYIKFDAVKSVLYGIAEQAQAL
jgi:very-short-patch-repair endonuclease